MPSLVVIFPLLVPINLFPFSKIVISLTSKLNCSIPYAFKQFADKNIINISL